MSTDGKLWKVGPTHFDENIITKDGCTISDSSHESPLTIVRIQGSTAVGVFRKSESRCQNVPSGSSVHSRGGRIAHTHGCDNARSADINDKNVVAF